MDVVSASREFIEGELSLTPDARKKLFVVRIAPAIGVTSRDAIAHDDVRLALVRACCDAWSAVRREARLVCASLLLPPPPPVNSSAGGETTTVAAVQRVVDQLQDAATASAPWYAIEGAIAAVHALVASNSNHTLLDVTAFVNLVVLPACRHEQIPVRDVAIAFVTAHGRACVTDLARTTSGLVTSFLDSETRTSASVQGALSLAAAFPKETMGTMTPYLSQLASSSEAAVRQLVADAIISFSAEDDKSMTALSVSFVLNGTTPDLWTARETGMLALSSHCTSALKALNRSTHDDASSRRLVEQSTLLKTVTQLVDSPQFELRRMATQLLPLLLQLAVRGVDSANDASELAAQVAPSTAPWIGRFAVYRAVLEGSSGDASASAAMLHDDALQRSAALSSDVAFTACVYRATRSLPPQSTSAGHGGEVSVAPAPVLLDGAEHKVWAFLDLCRFSPLSALGHLKHIAAWYSAAAVHVQCTLLAALDVLVSQCDSSAPETSLVGVGHLHHHASSSSFAASTSGLGGGAGRHSLFGFVQHSDFAAPELLDGGSDVMTGIDWIRSRPRHTPETNLDSAALTRAVLVTHRAAWVDAFSALESVFLSKAADPRVATRTRHLYRSAHRCGLKALDEIVRISLKRLRAIAANWDALPSNAPRKPASDNWDDSDDDDDEEGAGGDDGSLAMSIQDEIGHAARFLRSLGISPSDDPSLAKLFESAAARGDISPSRSARA